MSRGQADGADRGAHRAGGQSDGKKQIGLGFVLVRLTSRLQRST